MSVCVNDTDGDGNCAACARNPEAPCRKSAGDALKIALLGVMAPSRARSLVDSYAHELAERQRAALPDVMERWAHCLHQDTISEVIGLIDPKVLNSE